MSMLIDSYRFFAAGPTTVTIEGTTTKSEAAAGNSLVIDVPSGTADGDLLLTFATHRPAITVRSHNTPTGWTKMSPNDDYIQAFYRFADGTESASYNFNTDATVSQRAGIMYRISGASTTIAPRWVDEAVGVDPPAISPPWGVLNNTLFIAPLARTYGWEDVGTQPSGFTYDTAAVAGLGSGGCQVETASLIDVTASVDPGVWTATQTANARAMTVAVMGESSGVPGATVWQSGWAYRSSTLSPILTIPEAALEDDLVVVFLSTANTYALGAGPSGWEFASWIPNVGDGTLGAMMIYHRVTAAEEAAETTSWTLTNLYSATESSRYSVAVIRGVATTGELVGTSTGGSTSLVDGWINPLTPTADSIVIAGFAQDGTGGRSSTPTGYSTITGASSNQHNYLYLYDAGGENGVEVPYAAANTSTNDEFISIQAAFKFA